MTETILKTGLYVDEDGKKHYKVRDLDAGDTMKIAGMMAKVTGDPRIQNAVASGEQGVIVMSVAACLLDRVPRDYQLLCADVLGVSDGYSIDEYMKRERQEAVAEDRPERSVGIIRNQMEEDIIKEMNTYPADVWLKIPTTLAYRDNIDDFLTSCWEFGQAMQSVSTRFRKPSKNGTSSRTKKS